MLTEGAAPRHGVWDRERRALTTGLVLTITLAAFESLAIATVMPTVEEDLGDLALYGWVFSGFFLASLVGIVATGILADRRGPALPFAAGLALFAVGLVVGGLAGSMPVLVAARVAQGLGAGAIPASAYATVGRAYPPSLRPRVFAIMSTAWVVPGVVGPGVAGQVEEAASWRWVFLGLLPLVAVAAVITVPSLARLRPDHPRPVTPADRRRLGRVVVLVLGVGLVLAAGQAGTVARAVGLVVVGLPVAATALLRLVPAGTVRLAPGLPATVAVRGVLTCAFFGVDAYVSLAVEDRGGSTRLVGAVLTATAVCWSGAAWVQERIVSRAGPRRLDRIAFALLAVAAAGMVAVALELPAWAALGVWAVAGFGMGLGYAPLSVTALGTAAPGREGEASAALQLCDVLGVSVGTGVGGAVVAVGAGRGWAVTSSLAVVFALGTAVAQAGVLAAGRLPAALPGD